MPTYEYVCKSCQHEFEAFQSMSSDSLKKCPECSKNTLKRKIGIGAGIIFKGSGFYETDYRSESYNAAAKKDKESPKTSSSETKKKDDKGSKSAKKKNTKK